MEDIPLLARLLADKQYDLAFNTLEIGALPLEGESEPVHALLQVFPSSRISAVELDPKLCEALNRNAPPGLHYYPCAIGCTEEQRTLYETMHPMCTSLYEPDERFPDLFNDLEMTRLRARHTVQTVSLNTFVRDNGIGPVDFIKMDIQGAELDVLKGGGAVLSSVLALVLEVEFVAMYKGQPLYGDVDAHLRERDFMLHRLMGLSGRVMKPHAAPASGNYPRQVMWCDALFTCDLMDLRGLAEEQLLKLAVLLDVYQSRDVALYVLRRYDELCMTQLAPAYLERMMTPGARTEKKTKQ